MTPRDRITSVYKGHVPDQVPYMLDLSHWFYQRNRFPWDISKSYDKPECELIDYHKKMGVGFYLPNLGSFYDVSYSHDVKASVRKDEAGKAITWGFETPLGSIERTRVWEEGSYSWGISGWGVKTEQQVRVLGYALGNRTYRFLPEKYRAWIDCIGDSGVCYVVFGYSGMGRLLHYWMGIEGTMYATVDWPDTVRAVVDQINQNNLTLADMLADSPVEFVLMGDHFSGEIQPPRFFDRWSGTFYAEAIRRLHAAGKAVAVHIDGSRLSGALKMIAGTGADCADAVTPQPMGDLTPQQCRDEAGPDFILSGGVSPDLWLPGVSVDVFRKAVLNWLELKKRSPRLIANAGDQVPPGAVEERIEIMRELVDEHGRY